MTIDAAGAAPRGGHPERAPVSSSGRSEDGDAPGLAALIDAVAAEGEFIAAVPGEPDTIEQSVRLVSMVLDGGLTLTLEVDGVPAGHVMVQRRAGAPLRARRRNSHPCQQQRSVVPGSGAL